MNSPILTFFSHKDEIGKTSLVYHLAWMFASLHKRVLVIDLDPQSKLTHAFLDEFKMEEIWNSQIPGSTLYQCVKPLMSAGEIVPPILQAIATDLYLLPGDVNLSRYEEALSKEWSNSMGDDNLYHPLRILSSFWQVMQIAARKVQADIILVDTSSTLSAINRSALIASDYVAIPLGTDLVSLQGLGNLGMTLQSWKNGWQQRLGNWQDNIEASAYPDLPLPTGKMHIIGYLCRQLSMYLGRPVSSHNRWANRIPNAYRESVLGESLDTDIKQADDPYCLATIKHYRSLMPMAQEHRKPIFNLTSADGAIGSHANAVQDAKKDFRQLAGKIAEACGMAL